MFALSFVLASCTDVLACAESECGVVCRSSAVAAALSDLCGNAWGWKGGVPSLCSPGGESAHAVASIVQLPPPLPTTTTMQQMPRGFFVLVSKAYAGRVSPHSSPDTPTRGPPITCLPSYALNDDITNDRQTLEEEWRGTNASPPLPFPTNRNTNNSNRNSSVSDTANARARARDG
jgi:hypothetical protein